jgi:hypothetical protein
MTEEFTEIERLLLMAAEVHGAGPEKDLRYANCGKVVGQTLEWAGLVDEAVRDNWNSAGSDDYHPTIRRVYGALIRMVSVVRRDGGLSPAERPGPALFEGGGNLGTSEKPRAFPHFTSCRLTEEGARIARQLLLENPMYQATEGPSSYCSRL